MIIKIWICLFDVNPCESMKPHNLPCGSRRSERRARPTDWVWNWFATKPGLCAASLDPILGTRQPPHLQTVNYPFNANQRNCTLPQPLLKEFESLLIIETHTSSQLQLHSQFHKRLTETFSLKLPQVHDQVWDQLVLFRWRQIYNFILLQLHFVFKTKITAKKKTHKFKLFNI